MWRLIKWSEFILKTIFQWCTKTRFYTKKSLYLVLNRSLKSLKFSFIKLAETLIMNFPKASLRSTYNLTMLLRNSALINKLLKIMFCHMRKLSQIMDFRSKTSVFKPWVWHASQMKLWALSIMTKLQLFLYSDIKVYVDLNQNSYCTMRSKITPYKPSAL